MVESNHLQWLDNQSEVILKQQKDRSQKTEKYEHSTLNVQHPASNKNKKINKKLNNEGLKEKSRDVRYEVCGKKKN